MSNRPFEEQKKMEEVLDEAKGILFAREIEEQARKDTPDIVAQEEVGERAKKILNTEASHGIFFIKERFEDFLSDEKREKEVVEACAKHQLMYQKDPLGTSKERMDFLRKILPIFYQRLSFVNPKTEPDSDTGEGSIATILLADKAGKKTTEKNVFWALYDFIEEEYGTPMADWMDPLIHVFLVDEMYYFKEKNKTK